MTVLPNFLKTFQYQALDAIKNRGIKEILFSGETYQIQVIDPDTKEEEWVFVQFDRQNRVKDSFCSCKKSEEGFPCIHQAMAILSIYGEYPVPLHCRFAHSLWHCICTQLSLKIGFSASVFQLLNESENQREYVCHDLEGKIIFRIIGNNKRGIAKLHQIFQKEEKETEETSIKFSNLSEEELSQWKKGRPVQKLSYELSPWSDLAKWWMLMQEEKIPYQISFKESKQGIPDLLFITFPDLSIEYHFSQDLLLEIIPSLSTVDSSLKVYEFSKWKKKKICYDKANGCFQIFNVDSEEERVKDSKKGIDIGDWTYISGKGFYSKHQLSLSSSDLHDVENILNTHLSLLKEALVNDPIFETPHSLSYHIFFDPQWNLHLEPYLFTQGDLFKDYSSLYQSWAYIDGKGFYRIETFVDPKKLEIPEKEVSDFINNHRVWLNTQGGFTTHLSTIQEDLSYKINADCSLEFFRHVPLQATSTHDFGQWLYFETKGFFSKLEPYTKLPIEKPIPEERVSEFIKMNSSELHFVKNFFTETSPISNVGLSLKRGRAQTIEIIPAYEITPEHSNASLLFFGEYIYLKDNGFYELPAHLRLPEKYWSPMVIKGETAIASFIQSELPALRSLTTHIDASLSPPHSHQLLLTSLKKQQKNYLVQLNYKTEFGLIPVMTLWNALQRNKRYIFSEAGQLDLHSTQFQWLHDFKKRQWDSKTGTLSLSSLEFFKLNAYEPIKIDPALESLKDTPQYLLKELTDFHMPEMPNISGLTSTLRTYQQLGVRWLWFLYQYGFSGLLCDDMGLGKTHQAMALLAAIVNASQQHTQKKKLHFLIICPTSVIFHWQEKLQEYLPDLKVWTFHGAKRSLDNFFTESDILLTSYGIWRREAERLHTLSFELAIFDELQIAKNQTSGIHRSLLEADAKMRLGLTGTPIENRLRELKSLFDIILPSYMPGEQQFQNQFIKPIEKEGDSRQKELLSRMAKPFILRRKKEDVLFDLPEKTEEISHCALLTDQKKLYQKVLAQSRALILEELEDETAPIPYLHIFALFSHLKQICNHPAAFLKKPEEYQQFHSGKWELFKELLEEARASGQKVVVFSQYLLMLDIIQLHLEKHHIEFATIRGSTVNRGEQLQRFNREPSCEVFVASLQAAGLGVDLTAGSVVIHYDRWWNAARENQATDRVHRIGQTRGVQVFKLMTKDTIEEHIHGMIERKGKLMEEMIGVDDHQMLKSFNRMELAKLLQSLSAI